MLRPRMVPVANSIHCIGTNSSFLNLNRCLKVWRLPSTSNLPLCFRLGKLVTMAVVSSRVRRQSLPIQQAVYAKR